MDSVLTDTPENSLYSAVKFDFDLTEVKAALAAGADPNNPVEGKYALVSAAGLGGFRDHTAIANLLLKKGADPNVQNPDGDTPLCVAAREGLLKMTKLLLKHGADIHATSTIADSWLPPESGGRTPLFYAAAEDHLKVAKVLIAAGADVNAVTDTTPLVATTEDTRTLAMTPLMAAARCEGPDRVRIAKLLIQHGAELDRRDAAGETALMFSARTDEASTLARHLIKAGAALDVRSKEGKRAIGIAAERGNIAVAKSLAKAGATLEPDEALALAVVLGKGKNVREALAKGADPGRYGLVGLAIKQGLETSLVETLLEAGSPIEARSQGRTPLMFAASTDRGDVVDLLLAHGAEIDAREHDLHSLGGTALLSAVACENIEIARTLLKHGASPDLGPESVMPPLYYACDSGNEALVRLLLGHGASVNIDAPEASFESRCNALHTAAHQGDPAIVTLLIEAGARLDFRIPKGETALHRAVEKGNWKAAACLVAAGAPVEARCDKGKTPLIRACEARWGREDRMHICTGLLQAGADIHARDGQGRTALWYGALFAELAELLVTHGAEPNTHDHDRVSVLAHAAEGCHFEEGRGALYVLAQGADPCFEEGQRTPLMWTGMYGCVPLAEALIAAGADVHMVARDGTTAGSMAKHYNRSTELIALLDRLGAYSTTERAD